MATSSSFQFASGMKGHIQIARTGQAVRDNASKIANATANLHTELAELETEIRADDDGLTELRGQLERIRKEKALVEARLRKNRSVAARHDVEIGPFDKIYADNVAAISSLYEAAKGKHAQGIELLKREFDYHPAYSKGRPGEFKGQPFKPK